MLLSPNDYDLSKQAILTAAATHTDRKGLSVLREGAENAEFRSIAEKLLTGKDGYSLVGVAELFCASIRGLTSIQDGDRRLRADRHYIVVDTDLPNLPNHADVFNTFPRPNVEGKGPTNTAVWRKERKGLLALMGVNIISKIDFRGGLLADLP